MSRELTPFDEHPTDGSRVDETVSREMESALRNLVPRNSQLDRDRLLFLAGRTAAIPASRPRRGARPLVAAVAAVVSLGAGWSLGRFTVPRVEPTMAGGAHPDPRDTAIPIAPSAPRNPVLSPDTPSQSNSVPATNLVALRNQITGNGDSSWSSPALSFGEGGPPPTIGSLRAQWLSPSSRRSDLDSPPHPLPAPRAPGALL